MARVVMMFLDHQSALVVTEPDIKMTKQRKQRKLPKRNYLVALVVKKSGAGKHKDRKKEQKRTHQDD